MPSASVRGVNINSRIVGGVVPGNDWTHPRRVGEAWDEKRQELAAIFVDFLKRLPVAL